MTDDRSSGRSTDDPASNPTAGDPERPSVSVPADVTLRWAAPADHLDVQRVLDGAVLAVGDLPERLQAGDVLVATADGRVVGAIVLDPSGPWTAAPDALAARLPGDHGVDAASHVTAIAVRRRRRARGIGTALIRRALDREQRLVADFAPGLRPFYEALCFSIVPGTDDRLWGVRALDASACSE